MAYPSMRTPDLTFIIMPLVGYCELQYGLYVRSTPVSAALKIGHSNSPEQLRDYFENLKQVFGSTLRDPYANFGFDDYSTKNPQDVQMAAGLWIPPLTTR